MRIVLDTNILISGLIGSGAPGELLRMWRDNVFELVTSDFQIEELNRVVGYPHVIKRVSPEESLVLLKRIVRRGIVVADLPTIDLSPDPHDNPILATAIAGNADMLVSGDKQHILALRGAFEVPILTAQEALGRLIG